MTLPPKTLTPEFKSLNQSGDGKGFIGCLPIGGHLTMRVNFKDAIIILILVTFGALTLTFGGSLKWSELVRGNVSVFIFSVATLYFSFSYDKWIKNKKEEEKRKGMLKGIYKEIIERARYLEYYQEEQRRNPGGYFINVPTFPSTAWDSAISKGYFEPLNQSWANYSYIYNATDNIHLNLDVTRDIFFKSTLSVEDRRSHLSGIHTLLIRQITETMVIINDSLQNLERELSITRQEVVAINEEIIRRIRNSFT